MKYSNEFANLVTRPSGQHPFGSSHFEVTTWYEADMDARSHKTFDQSNTTNCMSGNFDAP